MRHGQTDWNKVHKLQGRSDIPLNSEGEKTARAAHDKYIDVHFDVCYSSPLKRALKTAQIVLENRDVPIMTDERLLEMSFGDYEGRSDFLSVDCPLNVLFTHPENYSKSIGGAETIDSLFARTGEFLNKVVYPLIGAGKDVLIVGHGAMNLSIICQVKNLSIENFWSYGLEQCKLTKL